MRRRSFIRNDHRRRASKRAFTILELMLVLAVIVALAGLSWPRLSSVLQRESVMGNVEQVRQVLDHARVQAVEDQLTYQFRYEPNGRKYLLMPNELLMSSQQQPGSGGTQQTSLLDDVPQAIIHELSEDCHFYVPNTLNANEPLVTERLPEPWLVMVQNGSQVRDVSWGPPILYSPDGSATDGSVTVVDKNQRYMTLSVRGLTGAVVTSRIDQLPELFGASSN